MGFSFFFSSLPRNAPPASQPSELPEFRNFPTPAVGEQEFRRRDAMAYSSSVARRAGGEVTKRRRRGPIDLRWSSAADLHIPGYLRRPAGRLLTQ